MRRIRLVWACRPSFDLPRMLDVGPGDWVTPNKQLFCYNFGGSESSIPILAPMCGRIAQISLEPDQIALDLETPCDCIRHPPQHIN